MKLEDFVGRWFQKKALRPGCGHKAIYLVICINWLKGAKSHYQRTDEIVLRSVLSPTYEHVEPNEMVDWVEITDEAVTGLLKDILVED